jgi:pilus assembly protein CpaF
MMSPLMNMLFIVLIILALIALLFVKITGRKDKVPQKNKEVNSEEDYQIPILIKHIQKSFNDITNTNLYDLGLDEEEFLRRKRKRNELVAALKSCNTGNASDKQYVKDYIADLLIHTYNINETTVDIPIPFEKPTNLSVQDKFDIVLHFYKQKYAVKALSMLIDKYQLDQPKGDEGDTFRITPEEINQIYDKEIKHKLKFEDKLQIVTQRIFSFYKGFGVIDEIRDMTIDGVSGGVSGLPRSVNTIEQDMEMLSAMQSKPSTVDSVWIMYKGKTMHLSFLSFGTESELRRVVQNVYKNNNPGQLSESRPYIINEMADGSRVVVVRPSFSESWAFFIRKFDVPSATLPSLITDQNGEMVIKLLKFLMAGCRITGITGAQGTGKTTLLMAMIKHINPAHTLRIQETAFELNLRKIYPERNILSFQETDMVSGQEGLDLQKKTDGSVNILGEVATDPVAAWMIQMSQVASLFTIFTHHAKTFNNLVSALRNSLLKSGIFSDEKIAEMEVINAINFDIHLRRDSNGNRYIERITECIPLNQDEDYPTEWKDKEESKEKMDAFMDTMAEYFRRKTDRKTFEGRNIIEYRNGRYEAVNPISNRQVNEMVEHFNEDQLNEFKVFVKKQWGDEVVA